MNLVVEPTGRSSGNLICGALRFRSALGRGGVRADKHEGDGATPVGTFALRRLFYRADRMARPVCGFATEALDPAFGWCDDPDHADYNRFVTLPFDGGHERLWRADALYDIVVVMGYNDAPIVAGAGSAIFLHIATPDYGATEGCVALAPDDLRQVLMACDGASTIRILPARLG